MGSTKEMLYDLQMQEDERRLAKLIGLSYEELISVEWTVDELQDRDGIIHRYVYTFSEEGDEEVLDKIHELHGSYDVGFSPWELEDEYDVINDQFDALMRSKYAYEKFCDNLNDLDSLRKTVTGNWNMVEILRRQVFSGIITSMEAFFSEVMANLVLEDQSNYRRFVETHPEFADMKVPVSEIYKQEDYILKHVKRIIVETLYHDLPKVANMFRATFEIEVPSIAKMQKHVMMRHDVVHRAGRSKSGLESLIDDETIDTLLKDVRDFVDSMAASLDIKTESGITN